MDLLRVIDYSVEEPQFNMALDEAIARFVGNGKSNPTLRIYGWKPAAVSVGFFQEVREEVDLEFCRSRGIDVVRRLSGGGAVLHAEGGLTYSLSVKDHDPSIPEDVLESYRAICEPIVAALRRICVEATFRPINDIEVGGRKVSGSAQTRRFGAILQHGTLLLDLDFSLLSALKPRQQKLEEKGAKSINERVTTIRNVLKREVDIGKMFSALIGEFGRFFGCELHHEVASDDELGMAFDLIEKYRSENWIFRR